MRCRTTHLGSLNIYSLLHSFKCHVLSLVREIRPRQLGSWVVFVVSLGAVFWHTPLDRADFHVIDQCMYINKYLVLGILGHVASTYLVQS